MVTDLAYSDCLDELAQYRSELEDLLWDFDDYVELDEFDADKFEQLQKASRKVAPKIMDILKRMKLVAPPPPARHSLPPSTLDEAARSTVSYSPVTQSSMSAILSKSPSNGTPVDEIGQALTTMGATAGPDEGLSGRPMTTMHDDLGRRDSRRSEFSEPFSEPPRPPSTNPWQLDRAPPTTADEGFNGEAPKRRPSVYNDSPTLYPNALYSAINPQNHDPEHRRLSTQREEDELRMRTASRSIAASSEGSFSPPPQNIRWTTSTYGSNDSTAASIGVGRQQQPPMEMSRSPPNGNGMIGNLDEHSTGRSPSDASLFSYPSSYIHGDNVEKSRARGDSLIGDQCFPPRQASLQTPDQQLPKRQPSAESVNSSVFDVIEYASNGSGSMGNPKRNSALSAAPSSVYSPIVLQPPAYPSHPIPYQLPGQADDSPSRPTSGQSLATLAGNSGPNSGEYSPTIIDGLIPVETEGSVQNMPLPQRQPDCSIGPHSSFYKLKGFCKGAEEARRGGLGFKKIKRPVGVSNAPGHQMICLTEDRKLTVVRVFQWLSSRSARTVCSNSSIKVWSKILITTVGTPVLFILETKLTHDLAAGNYTANSIGFRLRILQKSHVTVRHVEEQLYGCVFCIEQGKTTEESDATVFFTQKQLFLHLARHPRPLPPVPGLTIIEGPDMPPHLKDNFDLHFPNPPIQSVMTGIMPEVSRLPTAVATETRKYQNGAMRSPPDRASVLHFAVGARIVGIEFPLRYDGKWGIGWHDGVRAAFEADTVLLDVPPKSEIRMQGTSNIQAVARWKWNQKGGDEKWLRFDKGDIIKNISCKAKPAFTSSCCYQHGPFKAR